MSHSSEQSWVLQNWWFTTLLGSDVPICPPLRTECRADVAIVGAGMAGLSAALRLSESGRKVVVLERNICGGSSSGKSAGFLTPDSELELSQILRRFGPERAHDLWQVPERGIQLIVETATRHGIDCDLQHQDSLFVANDRAGEADVREELAARRRLHYPVTSYDAGMLPSVLGSSAYRGGVRYGDTYGINALRYCLGAKRLLLERGVRIFESTEVRAIQGHTLQTHAGSVTADQIIVCADKLQPSLTPYAANVFHAQTFLSISEPLTDREVDALFPRGPLQCWDTDLVYTYWRLTGDQRLLVGGGSALTTFTRQAVRSPHVMGGVIRRLKGRIPTLSSVRFIQYWPGLIDTTRDLFPTVLRDERSPWVHFVLGCVGLPWAAFCGDFAARNVLAPEAEDDSRYYRYFQPDRRFLMPLWTEKLLGRPVVFALNNAWAKYYQVDREREGTTGPP